MHWLCAYDPEAKGTAPLAWHHEFTEAQERLRHWTAACGTRLNTDRPTRQIAWPGETDPKPVEDITIPNREEDFVAYMHADVQARRAEEDEFYSSLAGEV